MADTTKEPTGQQQSADKKAAPARQQSETKQMAETFTRIFSQIQQQAPPDLPELTDEALEAVGVFRKIVAALALQPCPTIQLDADKKSANTGDPVKLTWTSTNAQTVSIHPDVGPDIGVVTPTAHGDITVMLTNVPVTFTATATNPCCSTPDDAVVGSA